MGRSPAGSGNHVSKFNRVGFPLSNFRRPGGGLEVDVQKKSLTGGLIAGSVYLWGGSLRAITFLSTKPRGCPRHRCPSCNGWIGSLCGVASCHGRAVAFQGIIWKLGAAIHPAWDQASLKPGWLQLCVQALCILSDATNTCGETDIKLEYFYLPMRAALIRLDACRVQVI